MAISRQKLGSHTAGFVESAFGNGQQMHVRILGEGHHVLAGKFAALSRSSAARAAHAGKSQRRTAAPTSVSGHSLL
jgi:hypothetical protein